VPTTRLLAALGFGDYSVRAEIQDEDDVDDDGLGGGGFDEHPVHSSFWEQADSLAAKLQAEEEEGPEGDSDATLVAESD